MIHRFAIIAAGEVRSVEEAAELAAAIRARPDGRPPDAISQALVTLDASGAGHFAVEQPEDSRGAFISAHDPEDGLLEALLYATKDRDIAVFDTRLRRLYDPSARVDVDVLLPGPTPLPYLTRKLLQDLIRRPIWPDPEAPYFTIARADQDYIQVWREADGGYQLEYREEGPESHFVFHSGDAELVGAVMWAWTIQDPVWRAAVDWLFLDVEKADASRTPELQP